ncbi:hypothetical protein SAMN04488527_1169 [Aliiroseovarius crassostreae]|nr:hypothetical protein SAMN04488527_1169 [Aliiroseovarius crassostreae]
MKGQRQAPYQGTGAAGNLSISDTVIDISGQGLSKRGTERVGGMCGGLRKHMVQVPSGLHLSQDPGHQKTGISGQQIIMRDLLQEQPERRTAM